MLKIIHMLTLVKKVNDEDPKFKAGDHVRISKYKNIFLNDTLQTDLKKSL